MSTILAIFVFAYIGSCSALVAAVLVSALPDIAFSILDELHARRVEPSAQLSLPFGGMPRC